jgi:outer membrane lipoprotein-sorting protein
VSPLLPALLVLASACAVKTTVRVPVSEKVLAAKTATLEELLSSLASHNERITSLTSGTLKASYTSGKVDSGKLQAYHSAPGYILLKRPDSILLNIQNPVTKTPLFELVSVGDPFEIWYPRENKLFLGNNSLKEIEIEGHPDLTLRPMHIIEAILPKRFDSGESGTHLSMEEARDAKTRYYVLCLLKDVQGRIVRPLRKLWIDRSDLGVARQEIYDESGRIQSVVSYSRLTAVDGLQLPLSVKIDRPLDGYALDMEFRDWHLNPQLPQNAFEFNPPEGANRVELKEKGRSE